jgi:hypothetical protein
VTYSKILRETATRFATYPGDVIHMVGEVKGPNTLGEPLTAVSAVYDATTNKTRVGFTYAKVKVAA